MGQLYFTSTKVIIGLFLSLPTSAFLCDVIWLCVIVHERLPASTLFYSLDLGIEVHRSIRAGALALFSPLLSKR